MSRSQFRNPHNDLSRFGHKPKENTLLKIYNKSVSHNTKCNNRPGAYKLLHTLMRIEKSVPDEFST